MHPHEPEYPLKRLICYLQGQNRSRVSYKTNWTISTRSAEQLHYPHPTLTRLSPTRAKQERRKAECTGRKTGLEVHRHIYHRGKVCEKKMEPKREHINHKICMSTTSKALFKMSSDLSDISGLSPAHDRPKPELSGVFADLFDNKIRQLRENIDSASDSPDADPVGHDSAFGAQSVPQFEPVSETEVRETIMKYPPKSSEACSYLTAEGNDR